MKSRIPLRRPDIRSTSRHGFADRIIQRHQSEGDTSVAPWSGGSTNLVHRRPLSAMISEEIHHHHQHVEWKPVTRVSLIQPMLVRHYYFWRWLQSAGIGMIQQFTDAVSSARYDSELQTHSGNWIEHARSWTPDATSSLWLNKEWDDVESPLVIDAGERQSTSTLSSQTVWNTLPRLLFRQLDVSARQRWLLAESIGQRTTIQPYEWWLPSEQQSVVRQQSNQQWQQLGSLLNRWASAGHISTTTTANISALRRTPQLRWLPAIRLAIPPIAGLYSGNWQARERDIRRLSSLFHVSRLGELDRLLGGSYTLQLLNIWPAPEQTAATVSLPIAGPMAEESVRDPEDWLYHIVRLFNPHERRAVIEHNIRRLYMRAAERSFQQHAPGWSRNVIANVRQEWRRSGISAALPANGGTVLRRGSGWLFRSSPETSLHSLWNDRNRALRMTSLFHELPWLRSGGGDEQLRRQLYHPVLLRRYLDEHGQMEYWNGAEHRLWQENVYDLLGRYIDQETNRLSPDDLLRMPILNAAQQWRNRIVSRTHKPALLENRMPLRRQAEPLVTTILDRSRVPIGSPAEVIRGQLSDTVIHLLRPLLNEGQPTAESLRRSDVPLQLQPILHRAVPSGLIRLTGQREPQALYRQQLVPTSQSPSVVATLPETIQREQQRNQLRNQAEPFIPEWRRSNARVASNLKQDRPAEVTQPDRSHMDTAISTARAEKDSVSSLTRLGAQELEQLVQRVYRELQRKLKADYQRRGM